MNNGYTDVRMSLNEVCGWLTNMGYEECADMMMDTFKYHTFTKDGMIRKDIVEQCIAGAFGKAAFRKLECDVTTHMNIIPFHEAHVD